MASRQKASTPVRAISHNIWYVASVRFISFLVLRFCAEYRDKITNTKLRHHSRYEHRSVMQIILLHELFSPCSSVHIRVFIADALSERKPAHVTALNIMGTSAAIELKLSGTKSFCVSTHCDGGLRRCGKDLRDFLISLSDEDWGSLERLLQTLKW